jgi:predicted dehydrogenase
MIQAAVVGLGWWGRHIISSLHEHSTALKIVAAVDPRLDALDDLATKMHVPLSQDLDDVLANPEVEAVILATPHSLHEEQIVRAAAAGKHVFCEKPLTLSRASAERAINACEAAKVELGVGHERRFEPAVVEIARLIQAGELGTLLHVEANFSHDLIASLDPADWRASPAESPIPALSALAIHLTDTYLHLFGSIKEVFAHSTSRVGNWGAGDVLSAQFLFESGMTGSLSTMLVTPMFVRLHVFGSQGWAEALSDVHPAQEGITRLTVSRTGQAKQVEEFSYIDTVLANLDAFAAAVEKRAPYPFTRDEKLGNIAVMEAIIESAHTGQSIAL